MQSITTMSKSDLLFPPDASCIWAGEKHFVNETWFEPKVCTRAKVIRSIGVFMIFSLYLTGGAKLLSCVPFFGGGGTNELNAARNVETECKGRLFAMTLATWPPWVANERDGWSRRRPTIDSFVSHAAILSAHRLFRVVAQRSMTVAPVIGVLTGTLWQTTRGQSNPAALLLLANSPGSVRQNDPFT